MAVNQFLTSVFLVMLLMGCGSSSSDSKVVESSSDEDTTATYVLTFTPSWDSTSHPNNFPSGSHFSPLIGMSHSSKINIWNLGGTSSSGFESMAETGSTSGLLSEMNTLVDGGEVGGILEGSGVSPLPGTASLTFTISSSKPLVSIVTMIAPSPDWFIGVDSLNLFENGEFLTSKSVSLQPIDAGTDSGADYTSPNDDTQPKEAIYEIKTGSLLNGTVVNPIGTFTFIKQ